MEVRGVHRPGTDAVARELEQRLGALDGVHAVELNAVLGRIAVNHDRSLTAGELARVIGVVEAAYGLDNEPSCAASASHPADTAPLTRELVCAGHERGWLGVLGRRAGATAAPHPSAGVRADIPGGLQASAAGGGGGAAGTYRAKPLDVEPRPVPLPDGPVERVATTSAVLAITGYAAVSAASRNSARALGVLHAGLPKPAKVGRDAFTAQLGTDLCAGGGLLLDPDVLHRLDRVDTVVLDGHALLTGRRVVDEVLVLDPGLDSAELFEQAHELLDLAQTDLVSAGSRPGRDGRRTVALPAGPDQGPHDGRTVDLPAEARCAADEWSARGAAVFAVLRNSRPVGLVGVVAELDPLAEAVVTAAEAAPYKPAGTWWL